MNKPADELSILTLDKSLTGLVGPEWWKFEDETLSLHLGWAFPPRLLAKIRLIRVLRQDDRTGHEKLDDESYDGVLGLIEPRIGSDPLFFMTAVDIINNLDVTGDVAVLPDYLDLAYAMYTLKAMIPDFEPTAMQRMMICHSLQEDGIPWPPPALATYLTPFDWRKFSDMQFPEDKERVAAAEAAISKYIQHQESTSEEEASA